MAVAACSSAPLPKLGDVDDGNAQIKGSAALPHGTGPASKVLSEPVAGAAGKGGKSARVGDTPPVQQIRGPHQEMIVAFTRPTIVLFGDEIGNDGERVAASSISLPLQMRNASSNASRVQIDTAYGPRWVARSEITLSALPSQR